MSQDEGRTFALRLSGRLNTPSLFEILFFAQNWAGYWRSGWLRGGGEGLTRSLVVGPARPPSGGRGKGCRQL